MDVNLVLGSGPTGSACAEALLARGEQVLMIDGGLRLEPDRQALLDQVKAGARGGPLRDLLAYQRPISNGRGLPSKLVHGSDFPYRQVEEMLGFSAQGTGFAPSLAVGGFSNVWGAAALPYRPDDTADWPVTAEEMNPHYRAVVAMTGLAAAHDDLEELFPLFTDRPTLLESSAQARGLLQILEGARPALRKAGMAFGRSRLMVDPTCIYCGCCLGGCPFDLIYSSTRDLQRRLARTDALPFRHVTDMIVEEVGETAESVTVRGFHRQNGEPMELTGDRLFLAAGAAATTRIVLKSRGLYDRPVSLRDSQYFLFPILTRSRFGRGRDEALHALSQLFFEIQESAVSPFTVHLQVYTYSEMIRDSVRARLRFLPGINGWVTDQIMPHLIIVQGYLHSTHSGTVSLQLQKRAGQRDAFPAQGIPGTETRAVLKRLLSFLGDKLGPLGLHAIGPALEITEPGRGFHTGGSFPMRAQPGELECDVRGRLQGWSRIHLADASVFPSIPATTITLPAMANAHRIAFSS